MKIAKHTTTLYDIIQSELINKGKNEFLNDGKFTFFDDEYSFIKKIMKYDDDVSEIVDRIIFQNEKLSNSEIDKHFKKTFVNRFLNSSISRQTVEDFSTQVLYTLFVNKDFIENVYNIEDFLIAKSTNSSKGKSSSTNDNRVLHSDLPQSQVNLNVDNTELDYGSTNTISRNKDRGENENESTVKTYNVESLIKINGLLESVFVEFDKNCFMQVF